jgi:hypothetical protein
MDKSIPNLSFNLEEKSFVMFRDWTHKAEAKYPDTKIIIEDEQEIIISVQKYLLKSLKRISEEKDSQKKRLTNWCIGFLDGNFTSRISQYWSYKYIDQPDELKNIVWLKAIILYLDADELFLKRVNRLYNYLVDQKFPFNEETEEVEFGNFESHYYISDLTLIENWKIHRKLLEELLFKETVEITESKLNFVVLPKLDNYFSYQELEEIVLNNPFES